MGGTIPLWSSVTTLEGEEWKRCLVLGALCFVLCALCFVLCALCFVAPAVLCFVLGESLRGLGKAFHSQSRVIPQGGRTLIGREA
jgi:hypothetical protein